MSTKDIHESHQPAPPLGLGSSEGLGPDAPTVGWYQNGRLTLHHPPGVSYAVCIRIEAERALARAVALERERCAALCEAHAGMRGTGAWAALTAAADRIRDPERAKRDAAPDSGA